MRSSTAAGRDIEYRAYHRAADLAKGYADHWERETQTDLDSDKQTAGWFPASAKAGHWRIIEKAIRRLADEPTT